MKPVYQTKFGPDDGNCWAAFMASMLDVSIDDIPDLGTGDGWLRRYAEWVYQAHGRVLLHIWANYRIAPRGWHGIGGVSQRGLPHIVVGKNGEVVHDPHPDGGGLTQIDDYYILTRPGESLWLSRKGEEKLSDYDSPPTQT